MNSTLNVVECADDALMEHRFWLQILGDHSRFIYESLAPKEAAHVRTAQHFIEVFDQLLEQARRNLNGEELSRINQLAYSYVQQLRAFKLELLREHLQGKLAIHLTPTFLNHMVNELEEYLRILSALVLSEPLPAFHPVHHHLLWLLDASGHAASIVGALDMREHKLKEKGQAFLKRFDAFYLKAVEMAGYLRAHLSQFPALARFNRDVKLEMLLFMEFLRELEEMEWNAQALDTMTALMADHMAREECYYLTKLALVSDIERPDCDPAKPRAQQKTE